MKDPFRRFNNINQQSLDVLVLEDYFVVFVDEIPADEIWERQAGELVGTIRLTQGSEIVEILGSFLL